MKIPVRNDSGINCIGADANIGASALPGNLVTADVPATRCCHQWRPVGSHMSVNYL